MALPETNNIGTIMSSTYEGRRIGRFEVTGRMVREDPETLRDVYSAGKILILEGKYEAENDQYSYLALGECFTLISPGCVVPIYALTVHTKDGRVTDVAATDVTAKQ